MGYFKLLPKWAGPGFGDGGGGQNFFYHQFGLGWGNTVIRFSENVKILSKNAENGQKKSNFLLKIEIFDKS